MNTKTEMTPAFINHKNCPIQTIIEKYHLSPHPEGGWYKRTYESNDTVRVEGVAAKRYNNQPRLTASAILYLLVRDNFSAWHRLQSDETWCFHSGDSLLIRMLDEKGALEEITLGHDSGNVQYTVKANTVFTAETLGDFSFVSCIVTPGFDFQDFELISKEFFSKEFPQHAALLNFIREY